MKIIKVSKSNIGNFTAIAKLINDTRALGDFMFSEASLKKSDVASLVNDKNRILFILYNNEKLIGFCLLVQRISVKQIKHMAKIMAIGILPGERGKGYGSFLLREVVNRLRAESVSLDVISGNTSAIKMYKKEGFEKVGIIRNYWREKRGSFDLLTYCKVLTKK